MMKALIMSRDELERFVLIEEYVINGVRRFKFKDTKTSVYLNVAADNLEEAKKKAKELIDKIMSDNVPL